MTGRAKVRLYAAATIAAWVAVFMFGFFMAAACTAGRDPVAPTCYTSRATPDSARDGTIKIGICVSAT